jgi:transcriptional regulator with XRE-family HTH domain
VDRLADEYQVWRPETAHPDDRDRATALGSALLRARRDRKLNQRSLARTAQISERHLQRLERGERLTRASTLDRLARALESDEAAAQVLLAEFLRLAGATLADETAHAERVERRRARRVAEVERNQHDLASVARVPLVGGQVLERRITDKPGNGTSRQRSITYVVVADDQETEIEPTPEILRALRKLPIQRSRPNG